MSKFKKTATETSDFILTQELVTKKFGNIYEFFTNKGVLDCSKVTEFQTLDDSNHSFVFDQENHKILPEIFGVFPNKTWSIGILDKGQNLDLKDSVQNLEIQI